MGRNLFEYHPTIGYRFIPGIRARVRHEGGGYLVRCNRAGFRCDHELTPEKPAGTYRVLLFGDSYTAGEGVSNAARYGDALERLLPGLQVLNFGLPGSGTDQQQLAFQVFGRDLEYDLLLLCPMVENILRNTQRSRLTQSAFDGRLVWRAKPYFELRNGDLVLRQSPVPRAPLAAEDDGDASGEARPGALRRLARDAVGRLDRSIPGLRAFTQRLRGLALPREYNDPEDPAWLLMKAILERWLADNDRDALLCPLPTFAQIEGGISGDSYRARMRELCSETGAEWVDLLPSFLALSRDTRQTLRFPEDEHPTPACHELIAAKIAPHIARRMEHAA